MNDSIQRDELKRRLDNGDPLVLVEALPERHFHSGHLPGAINIPHEEVSALAGTALPDKDATIVVYCANTGCQNSRIAAGFLRGAGYRNVLEYVEGKADWQEAGYPLET
ncbi:Rhodanese-like domain protein [Alloalcanivorax xenomutans]|uniref:rhodanese-like domain-containing protein n=1 Tax=Alloalcanivorax xenomutans TaxID=1094342 RepID=UPI0006D5C533|nr:rhodanese-like domain-containing protein [Alloalcanivorax xenomutans]PHS57234.1 MAG: rhodanese-like domain-containing protein [Alcanivorax sp.]CUR45691.1 Rhodanese-like domain protein [Alloalcanivorax xenomutans]